MLPAAPKRVIGSCASTLCFECQECHDVISLQTAKRQRLLLEVDIPEAAEDDDDVDDGVKKPRTKTNGRPTDAVRMVLGCLLSGNNYSDYAAMQRAQQLVPMHHETFDKYIGLIMPKVQRLAEEMIDLGRYCVVKWGEGTIEHMVLTNDWFWLTRGHYSNNGSGTICDWRSGAVLAYRHYCRRDDTLSDVEKFEYSSKAMDALGFGEMLDEVVNWMEKDVDQLIQDESVQLNGNPKLEGIVLDGDSSTDHFVTRAKEMVRDKAVECNTSHYCGDLKVIPCSNHLAKNCGAKAFEIGHRLHKTCSCPIKRKLDGDLYKSGQREHRGLNVDSHPLVKCWQRGISAALRGASKYKQQPEFAAKTLRDLAVRGVEECYNHLMNRHDGPGFSTGEDASCRLHPHTKSDGTPYESRHYNDCADFQEEMEVWLQKEIIDKIDDIIHPIIGAVSQNASERVGDVALQYRTKETDLRATHYVASTSLAICHVQNVVLEKFRRKLKLMGIVDEKLEQFGTMESRLHELLGLSTSKEQRDAWKKEVVQRAKRSEMRTTVEYKKARKEQRAKLKTARGAAKKDAGASYKGSTGTGGASGAGGAGGAGASKGVVGHCLCKGQCIRGCPCKAAQQRCTASCHGGRRCANVAGQPGPSSAGEGDESDAGEGDWPGSLKEMPTLDASLVDTVIWFNFEGVGWMQGTVLEELDDPDQLEDGSGNMCNFLVYYEGDETEVAHSLDEEYYDASYEADFGCWYAVAP